MVPFARPTCLGSNQSRRSRLGKRRNSRSDSIATTRKSGVVEATPGRAGVRLKSQYSTRLYQWAKQYVAVGYKRVSLATLRKVLGLEDIRDNSGRVVQEAPLEAWANLKQRALDRALKEINKHSDIQLELEFIGRGAYRKVQSLGFRIHGEKTCETLWGRFANLNFAIKAKA